MSPYKRGKKWVGQVRKESQRRQKLFQSMKGALDWEAEMRNADWKTRTEYSLGQWANEYLSYAKTKFRDKTYREKRSVFRRLFESIEARLPVQRLSAGNCLSYLRHQAETRSGHAANKDRKNLIAAWNWGFRYLCLPVKNPWQVDRFSETRQKRYVPPERDFWKVYEVAEGEDQMMLLTYLHTAGRRGEIFQLRWEDVDFGDSQIRLGTRKRTDGSLEWDWLPMTDELYHVLLAHRQKSDSEWVFPNPKTGGAYVERGKWMRRLCKKASVRAFGTHAIRHLTGSILADSGEPIARIQAIYRHKRLITTERYLHRMADIRQSLKVLEKRGKVIYVGKEEVDVKNKVN